ncbi:MAG TPA: hypothetical protein VJO53_11415 [Candidatus Acidoferrales bacterium]|nr:hypothetical protein [Candidatus Acidoferrales bacterium]
MSQRAKIYLLVVLGVALAIVLYVYFPFGRSRVPGLTGVLASDTKFEPLDVHEPQLRLDELEKLRKLEYSGSHRNIFVAAPPPVPKTVGAAAVPVRPFVGPVVPPPPPPLQIPAQFFGFAAHPDTGHRVGFFISGEDVFVVAEGDTFLNNYRLVHIGNDSADVEEISSGRHATIPMVQPPDQGSGGNP